MSHFTQALQNYWRLFLQHLPMIILGITVLVIFIIIAVWVESLLKRILNKRTDDPLLARFLSKIAKGAFIVIGLLLALRAVGLGGVAAGLLAGAGLSAFVIGFAVKDIVENFLAGIILSFNRPFKLNDTITIDDYTGQIVSVDLRSTKIKTFDGKDIFIPNALMITEPLTNFTLDGLIRLEFVVGIDYDDDLATALKLITDTLLDFDKVLKDNPPYGMVDELATSTVNLRIFFWANTYDYKKGINILKGEVKKMVKEALLENGFGMPADIQEIKIYKSDDPFPVQLAGLSDDQKALTGDA